MTCTWLEDRLDDDPQLQACELVREHLERCEECCRTWEGEQAFRHYVNVSKHEFDRLHRAAAVQVGMDFKRRVRNRARLSWLGMAVAISAVAGAWIWQHAHRPALSPQSSLPLVSVEQPAVSPEESETVVVSVTSESPHLVVPADNHNPSVSIYWLYPTVSEVEDDSSSRVAGPDEQLLARNLP